MPPGAPRAWLLNFDAESELADPSARTTSRAVLARHVALAERVRGLLAPGDVLLTPGASAPGLFGRAWCPTPGALAAIARAGALPPPAPPFDVLRRVNHRRFCAELGQTLDGARYVTTEAELHDALAALPDVEAWVLKRPFGFAGRGQLRLARSRAGEVQERWVTASLGTGDG